MTKKTENVLMIGVGIVILLLLILLLFQIFGKKEVRTEKDEVRTEATIETEEAYPEQQEIESSRVLEEDLSNLTDSKFDTKNDQSGLQKSATKTRTGIQGGVFRYQGKPDLSFVEYDFGVYLTPVTVGSNEYVPIKFITKSYIKKLVPQIAGLKENSVPMTDKESPEGRPPGKAWSLDASGEVYYFVDFGQKVKRTNDNSTVQIPLNAYAGQKPGGYEIWLMYEAAVLNKQGFTQHWDGGNFVSNGDDGYDYAAIFKGFK